jgi:hypothetical protein
LPQPGGIGQREAGEFEWHVDLRLFASR